MRLIEQKDLDEVRPGVWRVRRFLRYDKSSGKAIKPSATFKAVSASQALEYANEWWERQLQAAGMGSGTRLGQLLHNRIDMLARLGAIEQATAKAYHGKVALYIDPSIGAMDASAVRPVDINDLYAHLLERGGEDGTGLSANTVRVIHAILKGSYRELVAAGLVDHSPMDSATPPPRTNPVTRSFNSRELAAVEGRLLASMADPSTGERAWRERTYAFASYLALNTGMREGEAAAVTPDDVRRGDTPSLWVGASVSEASGCARIVHKPKGGKGRSISVSNAVIEAIDSHLAWQEAYISAKNRNLAPLCCTRTRDVIRPSALSRWFSSLCRSLEIDGATFHTLRHTHATVLIGQGVDLKTVSERLGHARTSTTTDIYAHVIPGRDKAAALAFEKAKGGLY